ncbi:MAG TPA: choice-of-anchor X domain-containing protein [Thermoanaerobaculia bacterium]
MKRRSFSRKRGAAYLAVLALVLATTGWTSTQLLTSEPSTSPASESAAGDLAAPVPPPEEVLIQQRDNIDGLGDAWVFIRLSQEQIEQKKADGTADFLTLGTEKSLGILRDDGQGGDGKAGDGVYTGIASVDPPDLQRRANEDQQKLSSRSGEMVPLFEGRTAVGIWRPEPFDYANFTAGQAVRLDPAVAFLEPESENASDETASAVSPLHSSGETRSVTANITFTNPVTPGTNTFQNRVLMITNTAVIADPTRTWNPCNNTGAANGVWTFNHLMTQMANQPASGINPSDFVQTWLNQWLANQNINGDPVPLRARMNNIISQWPKLPNGKLDLTKSPLRLLAITPRIDLRRGTGGGGPYSPSSGNFLDAGELRFTFGFVAKQTSTFDPTQAFIGAAQINNSSCFALPFTVIFEYRVPKAGCQNVRSWAQQWRLLQNWLPTSTTYRNHLQSLTQQVVMANANPARPNGSALGQLRTNEVALNGPWELREFRLTQFPFSLLNSNTVEDTIRNDPGSDFNNDTNGTGLLLSWIRNNIRPILVANGNEATIPLVPLFFQGQTFLAGDSRVPENDPNYITFHWSDPNLNFGDIKENWARHRVSRAACDGCHRRETFTHFTHINPANTIILSTWDDGFGDWTFGGVPMIVRANPALPAELSVFLTGINQLGDPADAVFNGFDVRSPNVGSPARNFDDLARREIDITGAASMSCSRMHPVNVAHVMEHLRATGQLPENLFEGMALVPPEDQLSVAIDDMKRNVINEVH